MLYDENEEFPSNKEIEEREVEEFYAEVDFHNWLSYQEKLAVSFPQDSVQKQALENVKRYAAVLGGGA